MRTNFDLAEIAVFVLAAAGIVYAVAVVVLQIRRVCRKPGSLKFHASRDGSTHIIPGSGHSEVEDCVCRPRVDGLPGELFIEHRDLKPVRGGAL